MKTRGTREPFAGGEKWKPLQEIRGDCEREELGCQEKSILLVVVGWLVP